MNKYNKDELERLIFKENLSYKEIGKKIWSIWKYY